MENWILSLIDEAANAEGWTLAFDQLGNGYVQRFGETFETDAEATAFVTAEAAKGREYHALALELHNRERIT